MRVVHSMVECCPIVLVRTVRILRPFQKVLCTLVINHKLHKLPAEYAVRTATDYLNIVRWCRVYFVSISYPRRAIWSVEFLPPLQQMKRTGLLKSNQLLCGNIKPDLMHFYADKITLQCD